ncbi:MAG: hypothetical protein E6Q62_11175 [Nitrosomonas sp.]|nr:MAG: hypothetical protein E6Q62_11175 [Nitrosomonas sp.]
MKILDQHFQHFNKTFLRSRKDHHLLSLLSIVIAFFLTSGLASAGDPVVTSRCQVNGTGELPNGDTLIIDIRDENDAAIGSWIYRTSMGDEFSGIPNGFVCRVNGTRVVDLLGIDTGTKNGIGGYTFAIHLEDRDEPNSDPVLIPGPVETKTLAATRTYSPSRWTNSSLSFPLGAQVAIPAALPVTAGNAGNRWTWLLFTRATATDLVRCMYRGGASTANPSDASEIELGRTVSLARCELSDENGEWHLDPSMTAGSKLAVTAIDLIVHNGSSKHPSPDNAQTTVSIDLDVIPNILQQGRTDYMRLVVFDPTGARVYNGEGEVIAANSFTVTIMP